MGSFFSLILNENMKIYRRVRTWIMLGILVVINLLMPFLFSLVSSDSGISIWDSFMLTTSFTFFLCTIFSVIVASDSVSAEFSWGTIKLLLIRPWSRSKILLSKYIAVIMFSILCTVVLAAMVYLSSSLWFGSNVRSEMIPPGQSGSSFTLLTLLCDYANLFMTVAIAFMLSTVFRASGLAIGLSLFIMFTKGILSFLFNPERYEWAKYLLFAHLDLSGYITSPEGPGGVTLGFSLIVLAVYYIVFLLISWIVFSKRDVAA